MAVDALLLPRAVGRRDVCSSASDRGKFREKASITMMRVRALGMSFRGFKIYTRTGDKGTSSLFNGERRRKDDHVFCALGDTDELNAAIGIARGHCEALCSSQGAVGEGGADLLLLVPPQLDAVQSRLLDIGSALATPVSCSTEARLQRAKFDEGGRSTNELEAWMDALDAQLPPLRNFILPSGGAASASLHLARAICRRAERAVWPLCLDGECDGSTAQYLNRLSDYLFVSARYVAMRSGRGDVAYRKE